MTNRTIVLQVLVLFTLHAVGQHDTVASRFEKRITQEDLRKHLTVLASDEYEGRETGYAGQKLAAKYLVDQFRSYGIDPVPDAGERGVVNGYEQPFALQLTTPGGLSVTAEGQPFKFMEHYFYFSERLKEDMEASEIFVARSLPPGTREQLKDRVVLLLDDENEKEPLQRRLSKIAEEANAAEVRVLLIASTSATRLMTQFEHQITGSRMRLPGDAGRKPGAGSTQTIVIDQAMAEAILTPAKLSWKKAMKRARKAGKWITSPLSFSYEDRSSELISENILGYVEGSDRKEELVVVTAHYDHIGMQNGEVYNGADDDGSGTVALLEMAEAFARAKAQGKGPRRSILFMPVTAEEKGLLGSRYYSEHPAFPLESTVANLNIDMIGRFDSTHVNSEPYVYIIGSDRLSSELHAVNEQANDVYVGLDLDYTFNAPDDPNQFYFRSDHYNFARKGIPVIFYFSGVHEDYHGPKDEVDRIRFDLLEQRTKLVFHTAWLLANRENRIMIDKPVETE